MNAPAHIRVETGPGWELRLGRWQDVLAGIPVDHTITDAPYGPRTHAGYRSGGVSAGSISEQAGIIEYDPLTEADVAEFGLTVVPHTRGWVVVFGCHQTQAWWAKMLDESGRLVFAPVAWIRRDAPPRFSGDGPQRSAEWITAARPRERTSCGSLPGYYLVNRVEGPVNGSLMPGQKNLTGMRALVRDYTLPGELVCDPFAGTGTTLLAAVSEGRRAIGAEMDPGRFELAVKRLRAGYTPDLYAAGAR